MSEGESLFGTNEKISLEGSELEERRSALGDAYKVVFANMAAYGKLTEFIQGIKGRYPKDHQYSEAYNIAVGSGIGELLEDEEMFWDFSGADSIEAYVHSLANTMG